MPIVGLTHSKDGSPRIHRTVNCKVAIGLAPDEEHNYPRKLNHFAFFKLDDAGLKWVIDDVKQDHFGDACKSFWIVLIDDDPDVLFRTELAAYVKTQCWCRGDGERAMRRELIDGKHQGDFKIWTGPCANNGCPEIDDKCKPSGDLYFMLADYPTLGTVCRIHTSSYQSIRQVSSALRDLQAVTGGRLMGVRCKLFVMPAKATYTQNNQQKTSTKYVLGLELAAKDVPELMATMASTAVMFQGLQKQLSGRVLEVEEEDDERARELKPEFYPDEQSPEENPTWTEEERQEYIKSKIASLKADMPKAEAQVIEAKPEKKSRNKAPRDAQASQVTPTTTPALPSQEGAITPRESASPETSPIGIEYVDPVGSDCSKCGSSLGVHLKTCPEFAADEQEFHKQIGIAKGPGSGKTKNSFCVEKCILAKITNGETNSGATYQKLEFTHPESDGTALVTNWHKSLMPLLALAHSKPGTTVWVHRIADESLVLDDVTFVCGVAYASGRKVEKL